MLNSCDAALSRRKPAAVLCFFTHHRPHLAERDMEFFTKARQQGWHCEKVLTRKYPVSLELTVTIHISLILFLC